MASRVRGIASVLLFGLLAAQSAAADRQIDAGTTDWCYTVPANPRVDLLQEKSGRARMASEPALMVRGSL